MHLVHHQREPAHRQAKPGNRMRPSCVRFNYQQWSEVTVLDFEALVAEMLKIRFFWGVTRC